MQTTNHPLITHYIYHIALSSLSLIFFFFNDTATPAIYTLSLHDALPICVRVLSLERRARRAARWRGAPLAPAAAHRGDRKSTRLNSSHLGISYAVFCLKKKKKNKDECRNIVKNVRMQVITEVTEV